MYEGADLNSPGSVRRKSNSRSGACPAFVLYRVASFKYFGWDGEDTPFLLQATVGSEPGGRLSFRLSNRREAFIDPGVSVQLELQRVSLKRKKKRIKSLFSVNIPRNL